MTIRDIGWRPVLIWVICICALMQQFALYQAMNYGRLVGLVPWDDCAYIEAALFRLERFAEKGTLAGLVGSAFPVHNIMDFQVISALLLTQGWIYAPYYANALYLMVALGAVLYALPRRNLLVVLAFTAAFAIQPVTVNSLNVLKPDWKGGLLMAAAVFVFCEANLQGRRGLTYLASGLLGAAIVCKLTAFYAPVLALLVLLAFAAAGILSSAFGEAAAPKDPVGRTISGRIRAVAAELLRDRRHLIVCALLVAGPFVFLFVVSIRRLAGYIKGALSSKWVDDLTLLERALSYAPGVDEVWGSIPLLFVVFTVAALALAFTTRRSNYPVQLAAMVLIAGLYYLPLILASTSNPEFGTFFMGVVFGAALVALRLVATVSNRAAIMSLAAVLLCALSVQLPVRLGDPVNTVTTGDLIDTRRTYEDIVRRITATPSQRSQVVLTFFEDAIAGHPNVAILSSRRASRLPSVDRIDALEPLTTVQGRIAGADFMLTLVPDEGHSVIGYQMIGGSNGQVRFPASRNLREGDRIVSSSPGVAIVARYPWKNGELRLYRRDAANPPQALRDSPKAPVHVDTFSSPWDGFPARTSPIGSTEYSAKDLELAISRPAS